MRPSEQAVPRISEWLTAGSDGGKAARLAAGQPVLFGSQGRPRLGGDEARRRQPILLGRPSAFTSDDEHIEVLRRRRRVPTGTRRLHDWPEFREYELAPFTREERATFIAQFLASAEAERHRRDGLVHDPAQTASRTNRVRCGGRCPSACSLQRSRLSDGSIEDRRAVLEERTWPGGVALD